ncbi:MAG: DUF3298 domain-containing protein [Saprospiraceae bacterium]
MKNIYLFLVFIVLLSACKEKNQPKDITKQTNIPKIDTISYELKSISKESGNCEGETVKCITAVVQYVEVKGNQPIAHQGINNNIERITKGNASTIEASLDSFIIAAKGFFEEFPDVSAGYGLEIEQSVLLNTPTLLTIEAFNYAFTGGAHGNYGTIYYNFDATTGAIITLNDILIDKYEVQLKAIAEPIFKANYLEAGMTNYSDAGFYFESDVFKLTENFAITKEGLKFLYNPYEVAPYALGQQEIMIPYTALIGLIKPNSLLEQFQ